MRFGWLGAAAILGCATAGGAVDKTPCGANLLCASAPTSVGAAMMRAGYQGLITKDNEGDPKIESAAAGYKFSVYFYGCEKNVNCDSLQFYASFDDEDHRPLDWFNQWNRGRRFVRMAQRSDGSIELSYDISTIGGLNQVNFADVLDWWTTMLGSFNPYANEPAPTAGAIPAPRPTPRGSNGTRQ